MTAPGALTDLLAHFDELDLAGHDLVHRYPGGAPRLAPLVGMAPGTLSNKANPHQDHDFTVRELVRLTAITRNFGLLDAAERLLGRVGVAVGDFSGSSDTELLTRWADWQAEIGQTSRTISDALADGRISAGELGHIKREMFEDFAAALALLQRLEAIAE